MRGVRPPPLPTPPAGQLSLLDWQPAPPAPPAQRHSATSRAAAEAIRPGAATLRAKVLAFLRARGAEGATDEEMQEGLGMAANTQRPRRRELEQAGQVRDSGRTRPTASGRQATVWLVAAEVRGHG